MEGALLISLGCLGECILQGAPLRRWHSWMPKKSLLSQPILVKLRGGMANAFSGFSFQVLGFGVHGFGGVCRD